MWQTRRRLGPALIDTLARLQAHPRVAVTIVACGDGACLSSTESRISTGSSETRPTISECRCGGQSRTVSLCGISIRTRANETATTARHGLERPRWRHPRRRAYGTDVECSAERRNRCSTLNPAPARPRCRPHAWRTLRVASTARAPVAHEEPFLHPFKSQNAPALGRQLLFERLGQSLMPPTEERHPARVRSAYCFRSQLSVHEDPRVSACRY